jgi:hypothetical protein
MFFPAGIPLSLLVAAVVYNSWLEAQRAKKSAAK